MVAEDIKRGLQNYHTIPKWVEKTKEKIEVIQTRMEKTGGSIVKKPEGGFERSKFMNEMIAKKSIFEQRISEYIYLQELAYNFILWLPIDVQDMAVDKYMNHYSESDLERKYQYTGRHIRRIIYRYIDEYIEST